MISGKAIIVNIQLVERNSNFVEKLDFSAIQNGSMPPAVPVQQPH